MQRRGGVEEGRSTDVEDQSEIIINELEELRDFMIDPLPQMFPSKWKMLTPRQRELIRIAIKSNDIYQKIAYDNNITLQTLKNHLYEAHQTLGMNTARIKHLFYAQLFQRVNRFLDDKEIEQRRKN